MVQKTSRTRNNNTNSNRPAADKRPSKPRSKRHDKDNANNRSKPAKNDKAEAPSKMGTLGALLQEAGVTKAKK